MSPRPEVGQSVVERWTARWGAWWAGRRRRAAAAKQWRQAASVGELGQLTAAWLEGHVAFHPSGYDVPDAETLPLVPALGTLNRAGFLTDASQPGRTGVTEDGAEWSQRAGVQGWVADDRVLWSIVAAARVRGLICIVHTRDGQERGRPVDDTVDQDVVDGPVVVTTVAGEPRTAFGVRRSAAAVRISYGRQCSRAAAAAVEDAVELAVIDPVAGRDDVLWPVLTAAVLAEPTATVPARRLGPDPAPYAAVWSRPIGPTRLADYLMGPGEGGMTKPVPVAYDPATRRQPQTVLPLPYEVTPEGLADHHYWGPRTGLV